MITVNEIAGLFYQDPNDVYVSLERQDPDVYHTFSPSRIYCDTEEDQGNSYNNLEDGREKEFAVYETIPN